jgi:amidophosphoribosyltransferase
MCGIVGGFVGPDRLAKMLGRIQNRGFESAGVATNRWYWRSEGSVQKLIQEHSGSWAGSRGIAHTRYKTDNNSEIQPVVRLWDEHTFDAFAFNGQVEDGDTQCIFKAVQSRDLSEVKGAYSYVYLDSLRRTIRAGRDRYGFHPLYYSPSQRLVASETAADLHIDDWQPVEPGVEIDVATGKIMSRIPASPARCFFEYVYFSAIQSQFDELSIYSARRDLGKLLALRETELDADMIVPVPDSGIAAAESMAEELKMPLRMAIYRDRNAERTFVSESGCSSKYIITPGALHGKIILVDDSIIRGNTLNHLVPRLQHYCDEIHVRVTCPKITHACRYGIHITGVGAHTIESADSVKYLEPNDVKLVPGTCRACVMGEYPC